MTRVRVWHFRIRISYARAGNRVRRVKAPPPTPFSRHCCIAASLYHHQPRPVHPVGYPAKVIRQRPAWQGSVSNQVVLFSDRWFSFSVILFFPSFQFFPVIPAKAGIYALQWTPAFAGATDPHLNHRKGNTTRVQLDLAAARVAGRGAQPSSSHLRRGANVAPVGRRHAGWGCSWPLTLATGHRCPAAGSPK